MDDDLNCHFVSRFLTKPWEFGQRRLHYYDVKSGRFGQQSSESLFANRGINTRAVEQRLDRLIESPLSSAIKGWAVSSQEQVLAIDRWPVLRALALIFPFQIPRAVQSRLSAKQCKSHPLVGKLEMMCSLSESEIDAFAELFGQRDNFRIFRTSARFPLFYTSKGCFLLPLVDEWTVDPVAFAIPLTDGLGVVRVPKDTDDEKLQALLCSDGGEFACRMSVGTNAERVVIHPSVMARSNPDELGSFIASTQKENLTKLQAVADLKSLHIAAFGEMGIGPDEARAFLRANRQR